MAIYRLLQQSVLTPEDIKPLVAAYEDCLRLLQLSDRSDAVKEAVARCVIEVAQTGVREADQIRDAALARIKIPPAL
jgi:hypothetical protein